MRLATHLRRHGFKAARDGRSGAGWFKGDIRVPGFDYQIECKNQATIKLREWWAQTLSQTPGYKSPMLVIALDEYHDVAVVKIDDILGLLRQVEEDTQTIIKLRSA